MALFIVVLTIGVGALMVLINANAKAQNIQAAVSNVQFSLDSMAREIRTGNGYYCAANPNSDITGDHTTVQDCDKGSYLSIVEGGKSLTAGAGNRRIAYRRAVVDGRGVIERKIGSGNWVRLTDPAVSITDMHFNVSKTAPKNASGDQRQPTVTIYVSGVIDGVGDTSTDFALQTTVTQRTLDL